MVIISKKSLERAIEMFWKGVLIPTAITCLILLLFIAKAHAAIPGQDEFAQLTQKDAITASQACMSLAYNESKIDILMARVKANGKIITRMQTRVMLYTACMLKVYDMDMDRILRSLPTDGA